MYMIQF